MGAIIVPFETRAQREERLHRKLMATYRAYSRAEASMRWDAFMQALDRFVAFQMRHSPPNLPYASQTGCVSCPWGSRLGNGTDARRRRDCARSARTNGHA